MKRRRKMRRLPPPGGEGPANFIRGFVATGLLAALQRQAGAIPSDARTTLRHALQGGAALAAGSSAADAWQRGDVGRALLAVAGGAAGVAAIDYLTREPAQTGKGA